MKLPLSWLNEFVKVDDIAPKDLAEKLTRAGLQVESIETIGAEPLSDSFVVVDVVECEMHPDSDHLHVCKVSDGSETYQVVCGAPNMRQGIKTAFAKIGAIIPDGGFKIKKGKLRGVESFGMCCSEKELCIGQGASGIIEFPADVAAGTFVRDAVSSEKPETVFDIEVTWNRPDALSVFGLAREFAAILKRPLKEPELDFTEEEEAIETKVGVRVEDFGSCPRYTARVVEEVEDGPSPEIMAKRLEACGVRSLGLCVDVTNYVMLELGQPMHAFDSQKIDGGEIVVRKARAGETIKTLDEVERKLDETMLVICDAKGPKAVAGVMGGEESAVAAGATRSLVLESALFDPVSIKNTSTKLALSSESSYRYIRGVDKDLADKASRRAAHLLQKYGKAKIARGAIDVDGREVFTSTDSSKVFNNDVVFDYGRARSLIGIEIADATMDEILGSIGLKKVGAEQGCSVWQIPSWRWDLTLEADLVEEIARLYGLDNIPDTMPSALSISSLSDFDFKAVNKVRGMCLALGFTEAMHYSFLSNKELDDFDNRNVAGRLTIPDPVSVEYAAMRDSLLPQMLGSLGRNAARQIESVALFEIGKVFSNEEGEPKECRKLSLGFYGPIMREALRKRVAVTEEDAVLSMKGVIAELVARSHAGKLEFVEEEHPAFVNGGSLAVKLNGRKIGILGAVSSKLRHRYRMTTQMALCELELKPLLKRIDATGRVSPVPQYPLSRRDISLVAGPAVKNSQIVEVIKRKGGKDLISVEVFDIFKLKGHKDGTRSMAYSMEFRSAERTLTDVEVGKLFTGIVEALKTLEGVEVRDC